MERKKLKIESPRIIGEKIGLIGILALFLGTQAFSLLSPKSDFEKAKRRVVKNPADFEARLVLAEELLKNNQLKKAERELLIASKLQQWDNSNQSILGQQTSKLEQLILQRQENDPGDLEILIQKWQKILTEKPDYRDGWLKLSLYLIKVGKTNEAQEALEKAKSLDPNYEVVREVEKFLLQGNQGN